MALEPLSAFSLACNVLQIVETSLRLLGRTAECYKSGIPDEVSIIIGNVHTINGLNDELKAILPDPLGKTPLSAAELRLLLDSLKITKRSLWRSISNSIKSMWYQDKLASFEKAISESRTNVTLAFLLLMHENSLTRHKSTVKSTTDVERRILEAFKTNTGSLEAEIRALSASLRDMTLDHHRDRMGQFGLIHENQLVRLSQQLEQIWEHQKAADEATKSVQTPVNSVAAQQRLLQSLRFPHMQERKEEISSAYNDTYEWLFQTAPRQQEEWHSFVSWARRADNPQRIYWIHGKPTVSSDAGLAEWTSSELLHGVHAFVRATEDLLFFLIDGLDEIEGDEKSQEELIGLVLDLASYDNVKLCISSRPDNIFRDAFQDYPCLKLESLTYNDIETYVTERFAQAQRIQMLSRGSPLITTSLITFLVHTASGVFLWVRLVVHDLLRAARDGATLTELVDMAHQIPRDLDSYFARFIDSIPPEYRKEASWMFQITLYTEDSFEPVHGLRLLDFSYLGKFQSPTQHQREHDAILFNADDIAELEVRLDTTARRINSRCRGLIEYYDVAEEVESIIGVPYSSELSDVDGESPCSSSSLGRSTAGLLRAFNRHVGLLHRSLRDYLISPKVLQQLQTYSPGPFNTKLFLCQTRLAQIQSLDYEGNDIHARLALGLSSYVLSALGTDDMKRLDDSAVIAAQLRPIVESLGRNQARLSRSGWYLSASFYDSRTEVPDFLGVALDFDLVAYVKKELTASSLQAMTGLSVLNCALLGRFSQFLGTGTVIGNRFPNVEVLRLALELGADPNESCGWFSVWAGFIQRLDTLAKRGELPADALEAHVEAIRALLEYGADPELRSSWFTPGALIPRVKSDLMPVSTVLRRMLGLYTHVRKELQECIELADEKLIQGHVHPSLNSPSRLTLPS